ncbi:glycoside hydrolase family 1 protein [Nocardioides sp. R-C-SC26]|uniref:glycoside hydrolase family 1 protein n=1 Tax=Nocardioides sp. R-C-SC26 TaxID=2870414 RepID=UPI001E5D5D4B|nr:family 1 glycosylhydrolase [Nocardioides sp. R-C-SC26]
MTLAPTASGIPPLPPDFVIGAASSALQSEGAVGERGTTIWDTFLGTDPTFAAGPHAMRGADALAHITEDVDLLRGLGARGYRFSVSWSRVQPGGRGPIDARRIDVYDRLVDELLAAGIDPSATLYHWDLPQALEDDGGWLNRETVERFADYSAAVGARLGDRVAHWVPVNSPNLAALLGYVDGRHAPGRELGFLGVLAAHHLLLAHGRGVAALRSAGCPSIGCSNHHSPMWPASEAAADLGATKLFDALFNGFFLEPMLLGRYPADVEPLVEEFVRPGDLASIRQPLDWYGVSYYRPIRVAATPETEEMPFELLDVLGHPRTDAGWAVVPDALREWLITTRARFRAALPPLVITECGAAYDGVDDQGRIEFLAGHLRAVASAVQRGVDVRGFYVWSLTDNLAWTEGWDHRYGLVHVDPDTLVRTPKASYRWLSELIARLPQHAG